MNERQRADTSGDTQDDSTSGSNHPSSAPAGAEEDYLKRAQKYERAPDDFKADVSEDELQVPDYPVIVHPEGYGDASAFLASWGLIEDLQQSTGDEVTMSAARVAKILRNHYASPSFDTLDAEGVRSMHIDAPDKYLGAIMPGMDTEMNADGSATVQSGGK